LQPIREIFPHNFIIFNDMIDQRPIAQRALFSLLFIAFMSFGNTVFAQDGATLFKVNCAQCHAPDVKLTGPALKGVTERVTDKQLLYKWVHNSASVLSSGNSYFNNLYKEYGGIAMTPFPESTLSNADIDAILKYVNDYKPPVAATPAAGGKAAEGSDSSLLYGILTLILAVIALVMLQVNSNLKKLSDDKDGHHTDEPIPFYRNKSYITLLTLLLFVVGGFYVVKGAIGLGREKGYQPVQPIYYSHKVHAGINQINCLYCHGGAWESKQASIPSVNVCMNCHMAISEYKGEKLSREDGSEVNANDEIKNLYAAAGWDPVKRQYTSAGKGVEWIKIHNLPDHVYFNHSQHVRAGKVQCQTCHGEITAMDEVYQFAELSMGWCVNCHRETKVDFNYKDGEGNKFYSIYEKYHEDIKNHKMDSVTVENIGGLECQKCHY
jgi:cytochrome c551/c552